MSVRSVDKVITGLIAKNLIEKSARYVQKDKVVKQLSNMYDIKESTPFFVEDKVPEKKVIPLWFENENIPFRIEREKNV